MIHNWGFIFSLEPKSNSVWGFVNTFFQKIRSYSSYKKSKRLINIVSRKDDRIIGVLLCKTYKKNLHITYLVVEPNMRRQGIGRELTYHAIDYAKIHGLESISSNCRVNNVPILELNRSIGFQEIETDYKYENGDSKIKFLLKI